MLWLNYSFPNPKTRPRVVYTAPHCIFHATGEIHKPLVKLYIGPPQDGTFGAYSTMVLDDRNDTFSLNPDNGIHIPKYCPDPSPEGAKSSDIALAQLMWWLSLPEVKKAPDIRRLDKSRIFSTSLEEYQGRLRSS